MEIWVDNEKAWRLVKEYHQQGLTDSAIGKKLYKEHGLVSMRGHKPYGVGAIWALRNNGKPKRNICVFVRHKPGKAKPTPDAPDVNKDMPVDKAVGKNILLTLSEKIMEMDVDSSLKIELLKKVLH